MYNSGNHQWYDEMRILAQWYDRAAHALSRFLRHGRIDNTGDPMNALDEIKEGDADHAYGLAVGHANVTEEDKERIIILLRYAADRGHPDAIHEIAMRFSPTVQDKYALLHTAADFGSKKALRVLGQAYMDGTDLPKNERRGALYLAEAEEDVSE